MPKGNNLTLIISPSDFYLRNENLINEAIVFYQKHCKTRKPLSKQIVFDNMPSSLIYTFPNSAAMTSFFPDFTLIEFNPQQYIHITEQEKENLILHELGHVIGLEHVEDGNRIMNTELVNFQVKDTFKDELSSFCKDLTALPDRPYY